MSTIPIADPPADVQGVRTSTFWARRDSPVPADPRLGPGGEGVIWVDLISGSDAASLGCDRQLRARRRILVDLVDHRRRAAVPADHQDAMGAAVFDLGERDH